MSSILIAGDFCPKDRVASMIENSQGEAILSDVSSTIKNADFSIVNFECPVVTTPAQPLIKKGPNLCCKVDAIEIIKKAGFKCATLANNHFRDFGDSGCSDTINKLDKYGIKHVGGGRNLKDSQKILYENISGKVIALVNFCENEFSIATESHAGSAPLDLVSNYRQIQEAKKNSDYVIVIVHGGHELFQLPSLRMKRTYRWFVDIGADVVVNHHQHCYSGYELYNNAPIFYGIGNFCFDWNGRRDKMWTEGFMLELFIDNGVDFKLIPYVQCREEAIVRRMDEDEAKTFYDNIEAINIIINDDQKIKSAIDEYYMECYKDCEIMLGNMSDSRIVRGLKRRGLLPSKISGKRRNILYDYIMCESHKDIVKHWLENELI